MDQVGCAGAQGGLGQKVRKRRRSVGLPKGTVRRPGRALAMRAAWADARVRLLWPKSTGLAETRQETKTQSPWAQNDEHSRARQSCCRNPDASAARHPHHPCAGCYLDDDGDRHLGNAPSNVQYHLFAEGRLLDQTPPPTAKTRQPTGQRRKGEKTCCDFRSIALALRPVGR